MASRNALSPGLVAITRCSTASAEPARCMSCASISKSYAAMTRLPRQRSADSTGMAPAWSTAALT